MDDHRPDRLDDLQHEITGHVNYVAALLIVAVTVVLLALWMNP